MRLSDSFYIITRCHDFLILDFKDVIIFQCRTKDRASYVLSYGQPLAKNCISFSETVAKREWISSVVYIMHTNLITVRG